MRSYLGPVGSARLLTAPFGYGKARADWRGIEAGAPLFFFLTNLEARRPDGEA
ncbi:hypothetical protein ACFSCW_11200 [Sphingomonas tabacisoli]|uniref:Peptidylprolyl isomerase n=1 Tax=Sphingomonas tabacisoli TaxID=2249466 RepID=A0ABW4I373_9SPHN